MAGTDWLTAAAVLVSGLVVGVMLLRHIYLTTRGRSATPASPASSLTDLEAKRDSLLQQLRELDDTSSKLDPGELPRRRAELEIEAAKALRDIERFSPETAAPQPGIPPPPRQKSAIAGFAWGMAATLVIVAIVVYVSRSATERGTSGSLTGNLPNEMQQPADDIARLEQIVAQNPENLDARLDLAQTQLFRENLVEVAKHSRYVLERSPGHPRALAYQAFVRMAAGEEQVAIELLDQALRTDPNLLDGWIYLALVRMRLGEGEKAIEAIAEAKRRHPDQSAMLDQLLAEMQSREVEASTPGNKEIAGVLELDPSRDATTAMGKVIFIVARQEGGGQGPPLAVKRLVVDGFPLRFTIGQADSMMGQALPDRLRIEARVDSDGDPMTKDASDPTAAIDSAPLGTGNLRLLLR
ncbi:MAG TPA: tetratricopeptide repeat protein [Thermoanaerobaculia bacterium]